MAKFYYKDGTTSDSYDRKILHRLDGPAIEYNMGGADYFINDVRFCKEDFDSYPAVIAYRADKAIRDILSE